MNRIAILAAAAALIALPASAESIRISTVGKSPAQVRDEVFKAAYKLCAQETIGATFRVDEMRACVDGTTRATFAQKDAPNPKFAQR
ncbi:MAG TPA: hypothetical protein VGN89_15090 [Phenylobacterium sp.]|jgi:hypothetical protein|nr:hypothetical protein [Phenylobacterium sp.]